VSVIVCKEQVCRRPSYKEQSSNEQLNTTDDYREKLCVGDKPYSEREILTIVEKVEE
jgi:hypothetical protein